MDRHADRGTLYAGPDLLQGPASSSLSYQPAHTFFGLRNAALVGLEMIGRRITRPKTNTFQLIHARGRLLDSDTQVDAIYAGNGENLTYCLDQVFGDSISILEEHRGPSLDIARLLRAESSPEKFVFTEGLSPDDLASLDFGLASMPAWIKQRIRIQSVWAVQINGLRRGTRQEMARILRKNRFECGLSRRDADFDQFYEQLYRPFIHQRFGESAVTVDRRQFIRECRRGRLLQLRRGGNLLGAALLRQTGPTLAVVWSALDIRIDKQERRGIFDSMDYFSLMVGHIQRCRWLDLGPSRPDLHDGVLRYKAKWGAVANAGLARQATIRWACPQHSAAGRHFLQRHAYVVHLGNALTGVICCPEARGPEELAQRIRSLAIEGIDAYRVLVSPELLPVLPHLDGLLKSMGSVGVSAITEYDNVMSQLVG